MRSMSLITIFNKSPRIIALLLALLLLQGGSIPAASASAQVPGGKVLVVYSTDSGEITDEVRLLDLVLGHFRSDLTFVKDNALDAKDVAKAAYLVYYGTVAKTLPAQTKALLNDYRGPFLAIGKNVEQLGRRFAFLTVDKQVDINMVTKPNDDDRMLLDVNVQVEHVTLLEGETVLTGWKGTYAYPLMVKNGEAAYFAASDLFSPFSEFLGEGLHSFFPEQHAEGHLALIRLEDIHPQSDPRLLKEAGDFLADKGIPFVIALIPVYINPHTKEGFHLKDRPELVEVLRHLRDRGASIVLHGYMHQYRESETGEGFEFWDVENNSPIFSPPNGITPLKKRYEFSSQREYELYQNDIADFEEHYIRTRIENGIRELTELGLPPVAFEAPHYTMSQKGYQIVSEFFPYLLGQTQLGDRDWKQMGTSPFISRPSFLHGMTLLPETVGYYDPNSLTPLEDIITKARQVQFVRDGVLGMFYHPYLGTEHLKEMIGFLETIPDLTWIDLQQKSKPIGGVPTSPPVNDSAQDLLKMGLPDLEENNWVQKVLWGIAAFVSIMVVLFLLYTGRNRANLRKQLFQERDLHG